MRPTDRRDAVIYRYHHSVLAMGVASIVALAAFICTARSITKVETCTSSQNNCLGISVDVTEIIIASEAPKLRGWPPGEPLEGPNGP